MVAVAGPALLLIGLVMVYSASIAVADSSRFTGHRPDFFLIRQAVFLLIGVWRRWSRSRCRCGPGRQGSPWLFLGGIVLLMLVLIPASARGERRAALAKSLGPVNLQPSELMKLFTVLYAADYTVRKAAPHGLLPRGFLPMAVRDGCSSAAAAAARTRLRRLRGHRAVIAMGMLFLGGINWQAVSAADWSAMIGFRADPSSNYRLQRISSASSTRGRTRSARATSSRIR
jgi:cell division protein FtsW